MNTVACQPMYGWNTLSWKHIERGVFKLQKRIYQAQRHGKVKQVRMRQRLLLCIGAREWAIILASQHELQDSCKDKKDDARNAGYATKQEICSKLTTSSRKHKAGKMPTTTGNCCTDTAMIARRLKTVIGMHDKHQTVEEPCAGKLASTVLKQRWEERFSHRL
jgi:N-terminal domain of reverse transcriptase